MEDCLVVIPARAGSKGIKGKNKKNFLGKPLIQYSIEIAKQFVDSKHICVSTDDDDIISLTKELGLEVPFKRPQDLSSDKASSNDVLLHALAHYEKHGRSYKKILLLQPTSPFRELTQLKEANALYAEHVDMVVSVKETEANPYYNLFEEQDGLLNKSKESSYTRRQDCPNVYEYNGSIYVINTQSLINKGLGGFDKIKKYVMPNEYSVDLDVPLDWKIAEVIGKEFFKM